MNQPDFVWRQVGSMWPQDEVFATAGRREHLQFQLRPRFRQALYVALAGVVVVLAIACANLTNLLLARGVARQKELAVRAALGAGRHRMVAQLLTEASVLGILGAAAGTVLAEVLIRAAVPLLPAEMPYTADLRIDSRALAWAAALGVFVSMAVGILPALRLSRGSLATSLNESSRGSSSANDRVRRVIVGATVAASLVLVCSSFLLFKSLVRLQILPAHAIGEIGRPLFDLVLNQDSFPEMSAATVSDYLEWIGRSCGGSLMSINHESKPAYGAGLQHVNVPEMTAAGGGFELTYRFPYWLRRGYVVELYRIAR